MVSTFQAELQRSERIHGPAIQDIYTRCWHAGIQMDWKHDGLSIIWKYLECLWCWDRLKTLRDCISCEYIQYFVLKPHLSRLPQRASLSSQSDAHPWRSKMNFNYEKIVGPSTFKKMWVFSPFTIQSFAGLMKFPGRRPKPGKPGKPPKPGLRNRWRFVSQGGMSCQPLLGPHTGNREENQASVLTRRGCLTKCVKANTFNLLSLDSWLVVGVSLDLVVTNI